VTTPESPLTPSGVGPKGPAGPSRTQQIVTAGVLGALAGAAALGSHRGRGGAALGAAAGAAALGTVEAVARARQRPGQCACR
jgi:hypothetical protein